MPRRLASGAKTFSASRATLGGAAVLQAACQRSVCSREARRSSTTRRSRENASSILRTFSVCSLGSSTSWPGLSASRVCCCTFTSLVVSIASAA